MIIHRALRDIEKCREKYGEAWVEYEKQVPYLFIPVRFYPFPLEILTVVLIIVTGRLLS